MSKWDGKQDGFGKGIWDYHNGSAGVELGERDDGHICPTGGPGVYFREYGDWPQVEKDAITLARGRVLDIGCGAGRVSLYLQSKGLRVVGIDNSPLAAKVSRQRGATSIKVMSITEISRDLGDAAPARVRRWIVRGRWGLRDIARRFRQE